VETGGIAPAFATAAALDVPLLIARKRRAAGMPRELLQESTLSQTRHEAIDLFVSPEFLSPRDRILILDDFLTNAQTMLALSRLAASGGAQVVGIGFVVEKVFEGGREALAELGVPVEALVRIIRLEEGEIAFAPE
jgi:xanthine phosphoribosyltransferase